MNKKNVHIIFELGSRDLIDGIGLLRHFDESFLYAFECNPDCLEECRHTMSKLDASFKTRLSLIENAVSITDGPVMFYPFDLSKYDNKGASSMLKIDFSKRDKKDDDYNKENPQYEIIVNGVRLDTFLDTNKISNIDLLCIDLQGYELNAMKSLGHHLHNVKYIITECSIQSTYTGGATFVELNDYLMNFNFKYIRSTRFGYDFPDTTLTGFSEFDALFIHQDNND